ncbi:HlyD family type I secretion periplasmic adaptor subunit [Pseudoduganella umbonata]|uniref:Membrane fusion protein (MFP) family protein n=1 Tax=Pseudoduganella umbonata TaxID=864828 RepID=A0A4P8HR35_9BURK|nr:HlyD family type I secretion periplasmic adaptor subunit [Pseudoduganella umbonata]MBB3225277.1 HlyD family secretion protein [Pseudoduganella umbonata]QCP12289.1 HlyD family type I secretion periplasmic adaptor subunit [Pseudoduganella umbonata]
MEPANKPPVMGERRSAKRRMGDDTEVEFLPDADAIERTPLPRYVRMTLHLLVLGLMLFILWASLSKMETVVTAHGRLVNPTSNIIVQPLETSIVQRIHVRVGQVVKQGEVLAELDPTFTQADEQQLRNRLTSLDTQVASLQAELAGTRAPGGAGSGADNALQAQLSGERQANFEAQKRRLDENVQRLRASIETNKRDQQVLAERLKSLAQIEAMQQQLVAENFGAKLQLLEARDRRLEVERSLINGRSRDLELAKELAAAEAERAALNRGWRQKSLEELLSVTRERDTINEQLAKADKRRQMVRVTAPAEAIVLEVGKLSQGSIVREAEAMFTLVPLGAKLEAEVQIDSADIGYISPNAHVHLKLDAFPFQKHGALDGKLRTISSDSFKREQVAAGQGTDAYYLARVDYGNAGLRRMQPGARLLPGMTVTAEIVTGERTIMSYLLWPLTKAMDESIREP